jgi:hypothetical protein
MNDADLRLDGNAAAGVLTEVFAFEVTTAEAVCSGCGTTGPAGALAVYGLEMGAILRCPNCDNPVVRLGKVKTGYWLDLRGMSVLRVPVSA